MSQQKTIDTLIEDIYNVFSPDTEVPEKLAEDFGRRMKELVLSRINEDRHHKAELRLSMIGRPDRKVWYDMRAEAPEDVDGQTRIKFLYGDMVEELILFLAKLSGHTVTDEQMEVDVNGVKGHQDCRIDGEVTDIKTASSYGMRKFRDGSLTQGNDPFAYIPQISSYVRAQGDYKGNLFAINKENAEMVLLPVDSIDMINPFDRVDHVKKMVKQDDPPDRCYEDVPDGASGNRILSTNCVWCQHKHTCWSDSNGGEGLRMFKYKKGYKDEVRYFTLIAKEPKVEEVK